MPAAVNSFAVGMALALMKNYASVQSPRPTLKIANLMSSLQDKYVYRRDWGRATARRRRPYGVRTSSFGRVATLGTSARIARLFQDSLPTYDFRRTERCIIPYATQEGEISFCAYNTGIGWRNIIEKMHMTATLTKWYEEHGRHEIYCRRQERRAPDDGAQPRARCRGGGGRHADTTSTTPGIAKTAREEKLRARGRTRRRRPTRTSGWPRSTGSTCSRRSGCRPGPPDPGARRQEEAGGAAGPSQADAVTSLPPSSGREDKLKTCGFRLQAEEDIGRADDPRGRFFATSGTTMVRLLVRRRRQ